MKKSGARDSSATGLFGDGDGLQIIKATFDGSMVNSFEDLIKGYSALKVLTYSNSASLISRAAQAF